MDGGDWDNFVSVINENFRSQMADYEKQRLENIKRNNEILKSLGLKVIEQQIDTSQSKSSKKRKREPLAPKEPTRVSLRNRGQEPEFNIIREDPEIKDEKPIEDLDESYHQPKDFFASIAEYSPDEQKLLTESRKTYQELKIPLDPGFVRTNPEMIFTIAFMPSSTTLMTASGDKRGGIAFWNIADSIEKSKGDEDWDPIIHSFKAHNGPTMKVCYHGLDHQRLYSCSYDSTIQFYDISAEKSQTVLELSDSPAIGHFDFEQNNIWFCTHDGRVGNLDTRSENVDLYNVSEKKLNTIHINPMQNNLFCTAGLDGFVRIYDIRKLAQELKCFQHEKSVNSAYWSPNGSNIVSTSFDDTIGIWKDLNTENDTHLAPYHNNRTGRWIQKFKALWDPKDSGTIIVGNMKRGIDLFDSEKGELLYTLQDEEKMTAIPAVNVFHPTLNIIASGNATGKMSCWQ